MTMGMIARTSMAIMAPMSAVAVGADEGLDDHGDGLVFRRQADDEVREEVIVPYPHGVQDGDGDGGGLEHRQDHTEVVLQGAAAVDDGGFLNVEGDRFDESGEHED